MCEAPIDDYLIVVLFMSFSRMGSMVLVLWEFNDKITLQCFRAVKYQEFNIRHKVFYDIHIDCITVA